MGLFETLLISAEQPVALDLHLARLSASLDAVYGSELPEGAAELAHQAARGLSLGRLRLTAVAADRIEIDAEADAIDPELLMPSWNDGPRLSSFELPGGLGTHKWRDRSALPQGTETLPLILDRGAEVLEAARASVFAVRDGTLFTPPLDGRILPGTTRATVLTIATEVGIDVSERVLRREELWDADEVFVTGSVRGVEPVRSLDDTELGRGELTLLLAERLTTRWELPTPARQP
jgi:para-aminobenzoate synthetase/4-amino-4-deoxychorismate lyase